MMDQEPKVAYRRVAIVLALLLLCVGACGHPQASPENLHLIASLRTALSAQNPDWLKQNADILQDRYAAGQVEEVEFTTFQAIIQEARDGRWKEAERQAIAFQKAQRPDRKHVEALRMQLHQHEH